MLKLGGLNETKDFCFELQKKAHCLSTMATFQTFFGNVFSSILITLT